MDFDKPGSLRGPSSSTILGATVWLDSETNEIRRVEGLITFPGTKTPKDAADRFLSSSLGFSLQNNKTTFIALSRETESLSGTQLLYQVYFGNTDVPGGLPILGSTVTVFLNPDNGIAVVTNNAVKITKPVRIRSSELLDAQAAEDAARRELSKEGGQARKFTNAVLGVVIRKGEPIPVRMMY